MAGDGRAQNPRAWLLTAASRRLIDEFRSGAARARTGPSGELIPLAEQDRGLWDCQLIAEGVALTEGALTAGPVGPFQLQAAIAAVQAEAPSAAETDRREITALYELLEQVAPTR